MFEEWIDPKDSEYYRESYRKYKPIEFKAQFKGIIQKPNNFEFNNIKYHTWNRIEKIKDLKEKEREIRNYHEMKAPTYPFYRLKPIEKICQGSFLTSQIIDIPKSYFPYDKWSDLKENSILIIRGYFWEKRRDKPSKRPYLEIIEIFLTQDKS